MIYQDVDQISVMHDVRLLNQIGQLKNHTMVPVAPPVIIVALRMTIVYVLIVSILEQLLKVSINNSDVIFYIYDASWRNYSINDFVF